MIEATQIRTIAAQAKIDPGIVEKDYVLSKILMALARSDDFRTSLVFKGGTALKKCYFADWRFSEDLDFTSMQPLTKGEITGVFEDSVVTAARVFGVTLRLAEFSQYPKTHGPLVTAQLKIGYDGPLRKSSGQKNNVRVDISFDEAIVSQPETRPVFRSYTDDEDADLPVYPLEEIVAEKIRSILQRGKSRDYYDVWLLLKDYKTDFSPERTRDILKKKCKHKGIPFPTVDDFLNEARTAEASRYWERGLAHQLTALPPFDTVLGQLRAQLEKLVHQSSD